MTRSAMYAQIDQFVVDKAVNVIVEEGVAPLFVREYWARRGSRVQARYNQEYGLTGRREYDLLDTFGTTWAVKCNRKWHATGNVYVETQAGSGRSFRRSRAGRAPHRAARTGSC